MKCFIVVSETVFSLLSVREAEPFGHRLMDPCWDKPRLLLIPDFSRSMRSSQIPSDSHNSLTASRISPETNGPSALPSVFPEIFAQIRENPGFAPELECPEAEECCSRIEAVLCR
ncbi:hypothetical protein CEXT_473191 [Caerostris extrusa]|uniref:Uncharacterized protein n=1 Tax=Caerostris extrusa TaxID=172846 RepID=A0AAV4S0L1_CAEEX|nr:hypothetical protein CEXT_473191 [Caerostris extrusa]